MKYFGLLENMEDWRRFLADPVKHWKDECSAKELARAWANCDRFPRKVERILSQSGLELTPLFGFPEYKIALTGGTRPSQTDLYVLAQDSEGELFPVMVEGKAKETFGPLVSEWKKERSEAGLERLEFLSKELGLAGRDIDSLRYQLLHRTVSVLLEGRRIGARQGMMLVHAFAENEDSFEDYRRFLAHFGIEAEKDIVQGPVVLGDFHLQFAWIQAPPTKLDPSKSIILQLLDMR